jgi:uncharacterized protein YkwD
VEKFYASRSARVRVEIGVSLSTKLSTIFGIVTLLGLSCFAQAASLEQQILIVTNQKRVKANLKPLKLNPKLCAVAREQCDLMAKADTLSHEVYGKDLTLRVHKVGYSYHYIAENIAMASGGLSAHALVNMWMNSKGHRKNILSHNCDEIGIGIKISQTGAVYYAQVFGQKG